MALLPTRGGPVTNPTGAPPSGANPKAKPLDTLQRRSDIRTNDRPSYNAAQVPDRARPVLHATKIIKTPSTPRSISKRMMSKRIKRDDPLQASIGVFLAFGVIIALAINTESSPGIGTAAEIDMFDTVARGTVENVLYSSVPSSSTDLLAAALGESIGGVLGATCGVIVGMITGGGKKGMNTNPRVVEAIADGDFFIANSASMPLLAAVGLPPALASILGVIVASIPSQLVKASSKENERRIEEKTLMAQLLAEEEERLSEEDKSFFKSFFARDKTDRKRSIELEDTKNLIEMEPGERENTIDLVEAFSDCTRWLAYDVLKTDFGGTLMWNGLLLDNSLTGAIFGLSASISSQLYADILYGVFRYGPEARQKQLFSRTKLDWLSMYSSRAFSTAVLFGVYEFSQGPISRYIQGTLAGGVDGCVGSAKFEACMQTYIDTNAPGPTAEAQFRALVINLSIVYQRLQDIAVDTSLDDFKALAHTWAVSFDSVIHNL